MGLKDISAACKEFDPKYNGIIIPTLKDYFEDYISKEQVAESQ